MTLAPGLGEARSRAGPLGRASGATRPFNTLLGPGPAAPAMRPLVALAAALALTAGLAGCLERRGTLTIELEVSPEGAIREFRTVNLSFKDVRIDARTLNPESVPSELERLELVRAAAGRDALQVFRQSVRADRYERIALTTPPGATFQGVLLDGTTVGVVVPNDAIVVQTSFDLPRGGALRYVLTIQVVKVEPDEGAATYRVVPDAAASGVR